MNDVVLQLFSTPVYINRVDFSNQDLKFINNLNFRPSGSYTAVDGTVLFNCLKTDSNYILNIPELYKFKENILFEIDFFLKKRLNFNKKLKFNITTSWAIKHQKGHFSHLHLHKNSLYSGVVYLHCNKDSGRLSFKLGDDQTPLFPSHLKMEIDEYNVYNSSVWNYLPKINDIIIFPSHLSHSVEVNNSDEERLVVAFNVFPTGVIGENSINELRLL